MNKRKIALSLVMALGMTMTYGVNADCAVYNGWEKSNGSWYYYKNGNMCTGWQRDGSTWYYMNSDGTMKIGWVSDGSWYYLKADGSMDTGWQNVNGTWYYFNGNGSMKTGWLNDGGTWYYLNGDGSMKTGWLNDVGTWYYLNGDGSMKTGWLQLGSTWYYLEPNGAMACGWYHTKMDSTLGAGATQDNSPQYYFDENGAWIEEATDLFILSVVEAPTTDSKCIDVTVINRSDQPYEFNADENFLQKMDKDGLWNIINLKKDSKKIGKMTVHEHSSVNYIIDVNTLESGKLEAGKYKIYNYLGNKYYECEFEVKETPKADLKTEHTAYSAKEDEKINYSITNNSNSDMTYGEEYSIQMNVDGKWEDVPLKSDSFIEIANVLKPGETAHESIEIKNIVDKKHNEIKDEYRLVKKIDGKEYYANFVLVHDNISEK